jgi:hypothetical protein
MLRVMLCASIVYQRGGSCVRMARLTCTITASASAPRSLFNSNLAATPRPVHIAPLMLQAFWDNRRSAKLAAAAAAAF